MTYLDILIAAGGKVDFRPMKEIALKIIADKEVLAKEPENKKLRQEIFSLYSKIGNREAAVKYEEI
ncbi:MAG: hypothetical protein LUH63_17735 [Parabacteroides sp.]|nr:hypothetical protein [Parabacteroides sp.]